MGSYFPNRWPLSYLNLTKNMKTYIRRQQHKKFFKHQDIKQKEPPQKYRLGTISNTKLLAGLNRFYMAITSPSASAVVRKIQTDCKQSLRIGKIRALNGCTGRLFRAATRHNRESLVPSPMLDDQWHTDCLRRHVLSLHCLGVFDVLY